MKLKRAIISKLISLMLLFLFYACAVEVNTKVRLIDDNNPPTFKLVGTGVRPYFTVKGPYTLNDKNEKVQPLWAITTDDSSAHDWISNLPLITYGKLPAHFKQIYPKNGDVPKLEEGMFYNVYVQVLSAEGGGTCIGIQHGKSILCQ